MKRFSLAVAIVILLAMLSGCTHKTSDELLRSEEYPGYVSVYADHEQGVEYLVWVYGYAGGITPRLNQDGTPKVVE